MDWNAIADSILALPGHLQPGQERWLFDTASALPDWSVLLEIGSYKGRSTCALAAGCLGTRKHVYTIDRFRGLHQDTDQQAADDFFGEFWGNVERLKLDGYVTPLVGWSSDFYERWVRPVHLLFIDGGHAVETVSADFQAFWPRLRPGGLLLMHDVSHGDYGGIPGPDQVWQTMALPQLVPDSVGHYGSMAYGRRAA